MITDILGAIIALGIIFIIIAPFAIALWAASKM